MKKEILGLRHPFFLPRIRRLAVVVLLAIWTGLELFLGSIGWATATGLIGIYVAFQFFVIFDPADYAPKEDEG